MDVPQGLEGYTGTQPVSFGVPFAPGLLRRSEPVRLVDATGRSVDAQVEITSSWDARPDEVRWLLVDALVPIQRGAAPRLFLEYAGGVRGPVTRPSGIRVTRSAGGVRVETGARVFDLDATSHPFGRFVLTIDDGGTLTAYATEGPAAQVEVETEGPVRTTVRITGQYTSASGATFGRYVTRMRFHARSAAVKVHHTIVWTESDLPRIASLAFAPTGVPPAERVDSAIDGETITAEAIDLRQVDWNVVQDGREGNADLGASLDGWVQLTSKNRALFAALRWPWQQHPTRVEATRSQLKLHVIGPGDPMSLAARDVAIDELKAFSNAQWDIAANKGPYGPVSPRGVAKTYEILVWDAGPGDPGRSLSPQVKNTLLQHPVYAYADPAFVALAGLPSPMSARDPASFPDIERAVAASFAWATRESAEEGDYGVWNYGDIQYDWQPVEGAKTSNVRLDRYWMNNGKGWSLVPWLLWMRSGYRRYYENGEVNSRHVMDVDTCHVVHPDEQKYLGGSYGYGPLHFHQRSYPADFRNDSEYLLYYYYLTGYERARDVMRERAEGLLASYDGNSGSDIDDVAAKLHTPMDVQTRSGRARVDKSLRFNREHYRVLGELALLYEGTHDARLRRRGEQFVDALSGAQARNGWLPGLKTTHWFSHSLGLAQRAFPTRSNQVLSIMKGWEGHVGNYARSGTNGSVDGPSSLWTMIALGDATHDRTYLEVAARLARTQALAVYPDEGDWRGYSVIPIHELGPVVRDWIAVMGRLAHVPKESRPTGMAPMTHFNGGLPVSRDDPTWRGRHVLYVLDAEDEDVRVQLDFLGRNSGAFNNVLIRVHDPAGRVRERRDVVDNSPTEVMNLRNSRFVGALSAAQVSSYSKGKELRIPKDGQKGAYAIEVFSERLEYPIFARSSTGKVVHYLPPYVDRAGAIDPLELARSFRTHLPSMSSPSWSGQAWFMPDPSAREVELSYANAVTPSRRRVPRTDPRLEWPRIVAFGPDGRQVCSTHPGGSIRQGRSNPVGEPCTFRSPDPGRLHSLVTANNNWHYRIFMSGVRPFFSSTRDEWFDPTAVRHVPPQRFLTPAASAGTPRTPDPADR